MKKVIYIDKIDEEKNKLLSLSRTEIKNNIDNLKTIPTNFDWVGPAYNEYIDKYNDYIKNLIDMNNKLELIALYLGDVSNNYYETNVELNEFINKLLEEEKLKHKEGNMYEV